MARPTGMRAFLLVWFGQVISMLGSAMTTFALTIWAYEITGSATALALVAFFSFGPAILFSPIAGALVDRWNRKLVMMLSDLGAGVSTIAVFILYSTGHLQIWHLYVAGAVSGIFAVFQWPAYSAAISTMLPKDQYARASGLLGLADSTSNVFAPIFATALLAIIGISGVMIIDIVTFVFAVGTLLLIFVPQPEVSSEGAESKGHLLKESLYGFRYILKRPSLLALQLTFFCINLTGGFALALVAPMLLARTGNNNAVLATVQSVGAIGGIAGGLLLTTWGGPKRRIHGVLLGMIGASLLGHVLMGVGQIVFIWALASFARALFLPILNGSNQAIWQAKVAPDVQGRVFSARRMIAQITGPLSILVAGPLADRVFEPAMRSGGALAPIFGGLVGTGAGAGMGLMFVIAGVLSVAVGLAGYAFPVIRNAEELLPDHEAVVVSPVTAAV
ncbi:MAG: MFS transporter [Chloroflexota bacterium]